MEPDAVLAQSSPASWASFNPKRPPTYVYALVDRGQVIYVGRTKRLRNRVREHEKKGWTFDDVRQVALDAPTAARTEAAWIQRLKPRLNQVLHTRSTLVAAIDRVTHHAKRKSHMIAVSQLPAGWTPISALELLLLIETDEDAAVDELAKQIAHWNSLGESKLHDALREAANRSPLPATSGQVTR